MAGPMLHFYLILSAFSLLLFTFSALLPYTPGLPWPFGVNGDWESRGLVVWKNRPQARLGGWGILQIALGIPSWANIQTGRKQGTRRRPVFAKNK